MNRITRKNVEGIFKVFIKTLGGEVAKSFDHVGAYRLDYLACYGGYNIELVENDKGGISHPFGNGRRSTKEMFYTLQFAINASYEAELIVRGK